MAGDAFIKINGKDYRLAFTMKQWEIQQKIIEEKQSSGVDSTALACMVYSAIVVASRQDGNRDIENQLDFADVDIQVDRLISVENSPEWESILAAKNESYLYKKANAEVAEDEEKKGRLRRHQTLCLRTLKLIGCRVRKHVSP